jgi:hypothetical protein
MILFLFLFLILTCSTLAKDPAITKTEFTHLPTRLFYFPDSSVMLLQEAETDTVHRSTDEGKTWTVVSGVPQGVARTLYQNDHHKTRSYILTRSETHYYSSDQGAFTRI